MMNLIFNSPEKAISFLEEECLYWVKMLDNAQSQRDALVDTLRSEYIRQKQHALAKRMWGKPQTPVDTLTHPDERAFATLQHIAVPGHKDHNFLSNLCEIVQVAAQVLVLYGREITQLRRVSCDGVALQVVERLD